MSRFNTAVTSFSSGEVSPKLRGRSDLNEYKSGLEEQLNMLPILQGGVTKRPGTKFVSGLNAGLLLDPDYEVATFPYMSPDGVEYILVMNLTGVVTALNTIVFKPSTNDTFNITALGGIDYSLPDLSAADPSGFMYAQMRNKLYITHASGNYPPMVFSLSIDGTFTMRHVFDTAYGEVVAAVDSRWKYLLKHPFLPANTNLDIGFAVAGAVGTVGTISDASTSLTAKDRAGVDITTFWNEGHVGSIFRISWATGTEGVYFITAATSGVAVASVRQLVVPDTPVGVTANWQESAWSDYRGWPKIVAGYDQRLIFGGTTERPMTMWCSSVFNEDIMMQTYLDQDTGSSAVDVSGFQYFGDEFTPDLPFDMNLSAGFGQQLRWATSGDAFIVGTDKSELTINALDGIFSITSVEIKAQSFVGSKAIQAYKSSSKVLYVGRDGRSVRAFSYFKANGQFSTKNLNVLSDEIISYLPSLSTSPNNQGATIKQLVWQQSRSILWVLTSNGVLLGVNINETSETLGWFKCELGGTGSELGYPKVLSMSVATNGDDNFDSLYLAVERSTVVDDSGTVQDVIYMEELGDDYSGTALINSSTIDDEHPYLLDCAKRLLSVHSPSFELSTSFTTTDVSVGGNYVTPNVILAPNKHSLWHVGTKIRLTTTGTLPGPLAVDTDYWVYGNDSLSGPRCYICSSEANALAGTAINLTDVGVGTQTIVPQDTGVTRFLGIGNIFPVAVAGNTGESLGVLAGGVPTTGLMTEFTDDYVEIAEEASEIIVGYNYTARIKTLPIEAGQQFGSSRGNAIRIDRANLMLYKTHYCEFGSELNDLEVAEFDETPFTGDKNVDFPATVDRVAEVIIESDKPLPLTVIGMVLRGASHDG